MGLSQAEKDELELLELEEQESAYQASIAQSNKPSELESGVRGAAQGVSMGFSDELTGGAEAIYDKLSGDEKDFVDLYRKHRDESRKNYDLAKNTNPLSYGAGEIGGAVSTAFIPGLGAFNAAKGATLATRTGLAAAQGGLSGLGLSNEESVEGMAKDTALGAGMGAAIPLVGAALKPVANKATQFVADKLKGTTNTVGKKIGEFAENMAENATGATAAQSEKFKPGSGRQLLDRGLIKAGDNAENIANRVSGAVDNANSMIDDALTKLDNSGAYADVDQIVSNLEDQITLLKQDPSKASLVRKLQQTIEDIVATEKPAVSLSAAEETKRGFRKAAGNWMDPDAGQAGKTAYLGYMDEVENAAKRADPELATLFKEGKETYGLLAPIKEAAERRSAQLKQSPIGGFLDVTSAAMDAASGGPGFVAPIVRRMASPRISSTLAVTSDKISKFLLRSPQMQALQNTNPQAFNSLVLKLEEKLKGDGQMPRAAEEQNERSMNFNDSKNKEALIQKTQGTKYSQVLSNAAQKGDQAFNAAHYVLYSRDQNYRQAVDNKGEK